MSSESFVAVPAPSWSEDLLTARARMIWNSGDYLQIAPSLAGGAEEFVSRLSLRPGERVLDLGCGTGNLALAAARAGAQVRGVDIAPILILEARLEAVASGCTILFEVGDVESLPYDDDQFDTTASLFGLMFAFRPPTATAELLRVTRGGGRIALASWTPAGVMGRLEQAQMELAGLPAGVPSPLDWGREEVVRERLGDGVRDLHCTRRTLELCFPFSPSATSELFATCYGPTVTTLRMTDPGNASRLRSELAELFQHFNLARDGTTVVTGEYLDVQARVA